MGDFLMGTLGFALGTPRNNQGHFFCFSLLRPQTGSSAPARTTTATKATSTASAAASTRWARAPRRRGAGTASPTTWPSPSARPASCHSRRDRRHGTRGTDGEGPRETSPWSPLATGRTVGVDRRVLLSRRTPRRDAGGQAEGAAVTVLGGRSAPRPRCAKP